MICYCGSVPSICPIFFRSDFAFAFHRAHIPCFFSGGFSMEGAPFLLQQRPQQQWDGQGPSCWSPGTYHTDDTFQVRADGTALRSTLLVSNLVPPVGCWARTTQTTPSEYVRTTILFGAHFSSRPLVASVHRQLVIDHSAVELPEPHPSDLFAPRFTSMLHSPSTRVASTSPKIGHRLVL